MSLGVLILAAGASRRFGPDDKLLAEIGGVPMVSHVCAALNLPEADCRLAVVSSSAVAELAWDAGFKVEHIPPGSEMSASLKAGIARLQRHGVTQILIALGDMPWVRRDDLHALLALAGDDDACVIKNGVPMPPAIFPASRFAAIARLTGDHGAGGLLRAIPPERKLALPPERLRDIDTPADLD